MKNFKVCILAAGIGSRSFDPSINKALLPLNGKAIISHIIDKFDKSQKFVIAVGYLSDQIKQYLTHAYPKRKFEFVDIKKYFGLGSGPGYSLLCCEKKLQCPFIITTSDTVILESVENPKYNWIGVAPIKNTENFCTVKTDANNVTRINDKTVNDNRLAWIGLGGIKDYKIFFNSLRSNQKHTKNEIQISNGLEGLLPKNLQTINYTWYDTGSLENYKLAIEALENVKYDFHKPNEYIYSIDNKIIKFFLDEQKVSYLSKRWKNLKRILPDKFKSTNNFLSYEKFEGSTIYQVLNQDVVNKLLAFLESQLWSKKIKEDYKLEKNCENFYKQKTFDRIKNFYKKTKLKDISYKINGIKYNPLSHYLKLLNWREIYKSIPSSFHGDLQFDNIIFNPKNNKFKLIDWRGDFDGRTDFADLYYDLAKLYAGCILPYNQIKKGLFKIEYDKNEVIFDFSTSNNLADAKNIIEKYFFKKKFNVNKIKILSSLIYLNMAPLHSSPFSELLYFLGISKLSENLNVD